MLNIDESQLVCQDLDGGLENVKTIDGKMLKGATGYYIRPSRRDPIKGFKPGECVYAEYITDSGARVCYATQPYKKSILKQVYEDIKGLDSNQKNNTSASGVNSQATFNSNNGNSIRIGSQFFARRKGNKMSSLTNLSEESLRTFEASLEDFITRVEKVCNKMESGVIYCENEMKDPQCAPILRDAKRVIANIRNCIDPIEILKTDVLQLIGEFTSL